MSQSKPLFRLLSAINQSVHSFGSSLPYFRNSSETFNGCHHSFYMQRSDKDYAGGVFGSYNAYGPGDFKLMYGGVRSDGAFQCVTYTDRSWTGNKAPEKKNTDAPPPIKSGTHPTLKELEEGAIRQRPVPTPPKKEEPSLIHQVLNPKIREHRKGVGIGR